ncbi:hypothetical protein TNCV_813501 [Trichonephila clavipes]|nr:hypothetical protein TNCV_813501 [Trichonephila clavipes]
MPVSPPCPKKCDLTAMRMNVFVWYTTRYPRIPALGIPALLREGQVELSGPRRLHGVVKETKQQNENFKSWECLSCPWRRCPNSKKFYDGIFPNSLHEDVHERRDVSYCTMEKFY